MALSEELIPQSGMIYTMRTYKCFLLLTCFLVFASCQRTVDTKTPEVIPTPPSASIAESPGPTQPAVQAAEPLPPAESPSPAQQPKTIHEIATDITNEYKGCVVIIASSTANGEDYFGSGFIVEKTKAADGTLSYNIMTNAHVINDPDAEEKGLKILTSDEADVLTNPKTFGLDPLTDVAVVQATSTRDLPVCKFGDSKGVNVLDQIVAIGNTRGYGVITSTGLVSQVITGHYGSEFGSLQTDAATNSGNSGCPIFNVKGEVVGMHGFGDRDTGSLIGFEIPSDRLVKAYEKMKADPFKDYALHGEWGLRPQALDADLRGLLLASGSTEGVAVGKLFKGSAADTAGLKEGDIITAINGNKEAVRTEEDKDVYKFYELMRDSPAGERVTLEIVRGGKKSSVEVVTRAEKFQQMNAFHTSFGFTVVDITPEEKNLYNVNASGVWVFFDNSKRDVLHHNLYNRTIITHIDSAPITSVEDFKKVVSEATAAGKKGMVLTSLRSSRFFTEAFGTDAQVYTLIRL